MVNIWVTIGRVRLGRFLCRRGGGTMFRSWLVIPIGIVGAAVGALSSSTSGRNLNLVLIVIFAIRLSLGGGIL